MVCVRIRFEDKILKRLAEDSTFQPKRWSPELVRAFRRKIQVLANVSDERDLRALKSLRLEQLRGDRVGTTSIRLNRQFRLVIRFETDEDRRIVVVIEMVDYH